MRAAPSPGVYVACAVVQPMADSRRSQRKIYGENCRVMSRPYSAGRERRETCRGCDKPARPRRSHTCPLVSRAPRVACHSTLSCAVFWNRCLLHEAACASVVLSPDHTIRVRFVVRYPAPHVFSRSDPLREPDGKSFNASRSLPCPARYCSRAYVRGENMARVTTSISADERWRHDVSVVEHLTNKQWN